VDERLDVAIQAARRAEQLVVRALAIGIDRPDRSQEVGLPPRQAPLEDRPRLCERQRVTVPDGETPEEPPGLEDLPS
jgi:hypothetical protein